MDLVIDLAGVDDAMVDVTFPPDVLHIEWRSSINSNRYLKGKVTGHLKQQSRVCAQWLSFTCRPTYVHMRVARVCYG